MSIIPSQKALNRGKHKHSVQNKTGKGRKYTVVPSTKKKEEGAVAVEGSKGVVVSNNSWRFEGDENVHEVEGGEGLEEATEVVRRHLLEEEECDEEEEEGQEAGEDEEDEDESIWHEHPSKWDIVALERWLERTVRN